MTQPRQGRSPLDSVLRCSRAIPVAPPIFTRRSKVPWHGEGYLSSPVSKPMTEDLLTAACLGVLGYRQGRSDTEAPLVRLGLLRTSRAGAVAVPVVVEATNDDTSCSEWLDLVRDAIDEADETFSGLATDDIELLIGQERDGGRRTLFSVLVTSGDSEAVGRTLGNDLTIGAGLDGLHVIFDDRLFDQVVLRDWLQDTATLLDALQRGQGLVNDVLAAATAERADDQLAQPTMYGAPSVADTIRAASFEHPDAAAIVTADESVSYDQFRRRYLAVARTLSAEGVRSGDAVGIYVSAGASYVASLVATIHIGAVLVPLDAQSPTSRLGQAAAAAGFRVLLVNEPRMTDALRICALTPGTPPRTIDVDAAQHAADSENSSESTPVAVDADAPGYILFTSGSTGEPKGVVQTRRTLDSIVNWQVHRTGAGTRPRTLQRSALSFDVALQEILSTVADGGTLYLPADQQRQDLSYMATLINEWQVERIFMPPSGLHALLAAADTSRLSSLREVVCAGEPLVITGTVRRAFREINARLDNQYGPTETHVCTAVIVEGDPFTWPDNPSIGLPVPGDAAQVVDALGRRLPTGTPGELVITGQTVALGYLHGADPKFTESLRLEGISTVRSYRTGDFARERPGGSFEFLGRRDEQLKVRGYRVELGDVEAAALATGLVADAVAFGLGGGSAVERIGLAVLPPINAVELDRAALLREMSERLPPYMMPRPAETVTPKRFESTPTGKVDRRRVAELAQTYLRERHTDSGSAEQTIRSLWERCLGIDKFDDDATFIALGGDSLAAVELAAGLQDTVGVAVSLRELLAGMTVRNLLSLARGEHDSTAVAQQNGHAQSNGRDPQSVVLPRFGRVACVSPAEARHLYLDVVVSRNYERFGILDEPVRNVVDVGANIGLFALSVLDRHPETNVIALEPHPGFAGALRANVGERVFVVEAAAAAEQGRAPLFVYEQMPAMSSLHPEPEYDNELMESLIGNQLTRVGADSTAGAMVGLVGEAPTVQEVQTVRLSDVMTQHQCESVGLLKVDVQHGEDGVFEGLDEADWSRLERIIVEVQDRGTELAALQRLLEGRGFSTAVHMDTVLHAGSAVRFLYAWAPGQRGLTV